MERVGSYELLGRVAESGTGAVWKGHDRALGRDVALKQVPAGAVGSVARLRSEAKVLARLSHPNIVTVFDLIESDGQLWLIEEWIEGAPLVAVLAQARRLSPPQAVGVVRGALMGLAYAHRQGVIHGDISPANVLLDLGGTSKLVDFGLAAPSGAPGVAGTPGYLSPEAARGMPLTARSDIYSAAALLAMLLRGRPMYEGPTAEAVLAAQLSAREPDLRGVDGPIRAVLQGGLAAAPDRRYTGVEQFIAALEDGAARTYGSGWLASAGLAGLVTATVTAGGALGTSALVSSATPGVGSAGRNLFRALRVGRFSARQLGLGAVVGGAAVVAAAATVVVAAHHPKPKPKPKPTPVAAATDLRPTTVAPATPFDLHTVDWNGVTVPGNACMSASDITLHGGKASIPSNIPGSPPEDHFELQLTIQPQYGKLGNGGPMVAAFGLTCSAVGEFIAGNDPIRQLNVAVFAAAGGRPKLLRLITGPQFGSVNDSQAHGSIMVPNRIRIQDGTILVSGDYLRGSDGRCCPSGRASSTVSYVNGTLVWTRSAPVGIAPTPTSPAVPTSSSPAHPSTIVTVTGQDSRRTYRVSVLAQDRVADCAANAYGGPVVGFLTKHPCDSNGATRRLLSVSLGGRTVALSVITLAIVGTPSDPYLYSSQFSHLLRENSTGSMNDLLRSGTRLPGWPTSVPADEAFVVTGEDNVLEIFDAWYLTGPTATQAPELISLENDLTLTQVSVPGS